MNKLTLFILLSVLTPADTYLDEFFDTDNFEQNLYKSNSVVEVLEYFTDYSSSDSRESYLKRRLTINSSGLITQETEFYSDGSNETHVNSYNERGLQLSSKSTMSDIDQIHLYEYEYDSESRLIKTCYSIKYASKDYFKPEFDEHIEYKNDDLNAVYDSKNNLLRYFKRENSKLQQFTADGQLYSVYGNGVQKAFWLRDFNLSKKIGDYNRTLEYSETDKKGNIVKKVSYDYKLLKNGLVKEMTELDQTGKILSKTEFKYKTK